MRRLAVVLMLSALACSPSQDGETLTVFAASSLSLAFEGIAADFEKAHPDVDVVVSLAGSQTLATQVVNGAQPDVFASADQEQMRRAAAAYPPDVGPLRFAANRLVIAVAAGNPRDVRSVADLAREDLQVVLGAEEVPIGQYGRRVLRTAGVEVGASSHEPDVGLVLTKVRLGEADAGLVYRSDLSRAEGEVEGVSLPQRVNVTATYPIAAWGDGTARDFVEFVTSAEGREELAAAGFDT